MINHETPSAAADNVAHQLRAMAGRYERAIAALRRAADIVESGRPPESTQGPAYSVVVAEAIRELTVTGSNSRHEDAMLAAAEVDVLRAEVAQ